jgi:hypothetical protein
MQVLRLYDPDRRPPNWTDIIRPGQFAAFAKHVDGGGPCDADGRPFASSDLVTCLIFDEIDQAARVCEERVTEVPSVRFEVFDSAGRSNPPILVVVNQAHAHRLDTDPRRISRRKWTALGLAAAALPLFWYDYTNDRGVLVLPTFVGINLLLAAGRLLQLNAAVAAAERQRQERFTRLKTSRPDP